MAKKGSDNAFGFFAKGKPNKKLAGPVGKDRTDMKKAAKGKPDRQLKGPVGAVFPIPKKGAPRKGKAQ